MDAHEPPTTLYTAGHGDRSLAELVELLREAGVERVVDVRSHPSSRRHPQFGKTALGMGLREAGIGYLWAGEVLGGLRKERGRSRHTALTSAGFRAYADHMATPEFRAAVDHLLGQARPARLALLCAERRPWECHRWFLADALVVAGARVEHLMEVGQRRVHRLNPLARLEDGILVYDRGTTAELDLALPISP
ncbi:MAG TPA: DUF488 domain-containing protein [bacterium]